MSTSGINVSIHFIDLKKFSHSIISHPLLLLISLFSINTMPMISQQLYFLFHWQLGSHPTANKFNPSIVSFIKSAFIFHPMAYQLNYQKIFYLVMLVIRLQYIIFRLHFRKSLFDFNEFFLILLKLSTIFT